MASRADDRKIERDLVPDLFSFELYVPLASRGNLFNQLKAFAKENGFEFYVGLIDPKADLIGSRMRRDDMWLSFDSVFEPEQYFVSAVPPLGATAPADGGQPIEDALRDKIKDVAGLKILRWPR